MDEDDEIQFIGGIPMNLPPEVQQAIQQANDQAMMHAEVRANTIKDFLGSLPPEHLATFRTIMHAIVIHEQPDTVAAFYEGQAQAILTFVHNKCSHCGEEHDDIEALLDSEDECQGETDSD